MRICHLNDAQEAEIEGLGGALTARTVFEEAGLISGIRTIPPRTQAPKHSNTGSTLSHLVYVMRGSGTVSNGEYYEKVVAGSFALFEKGERPYFKTDAEELVVIEVAWGASDVKVPVVPKAQTVPVPEEPTPVVAPSAPGGDYEEI